MQIGELSLLGDDMRQIGERKYVCIPLPDGKEALMLSSAVLPSYGHGSF